MRGMGQFLYYDAAVMYGEDGMESVRRAAMKKAKRPGGWGDEGVYLSAFVDARKAEMKKEQGHTDTTRVDDDGSGCLWRRGTGI